MLAYIYTLEELKKLYKGKIEVQDRVIKLIEKDEGYVYIDREESKYLGKIINIENNKRVIYFHVMEEDKVIAKIPLKFMKGL